MKKIEEQLWNYIDGNCSPEEQIVIEAKLAIDKEFYNLFQELQKVNEALNNLEFEEPSMSFTRNVMEKVNLELKPVALTTKIDNRIIYSIAALFICSIVGIFVYTLAKSDLSFKLDMPVIDFSFNITKYISRSTIQIFIFIDIAIALVYLDSFLRKGKVTAQKKGE